jgi:Auxiliary Activity family 9 (formerly GH61)
LTFEFREWVDGSRPGAINAQHQGPCTVFMKKVELASASNNAAGDGWFKIWDEGYDEAAGKWCTTKLIDNNGHLSVTVPSDIEGGNYLVRPELLALHAAQDNPPDPQFYVGCAQINLEGTGSAKPATVTIPENYVDISMPGLTFNIYKTPLALPYPMYGPPAYKGGGSQNSPAPPSTATASPVSSANAVASPSVSAYVKAADGTTPDAAAPSDAAADDSSDEECDANAADDTGSDSTDQPTGYSADPAVSASKSTPAPTSASATESSATPIVTNNQTSSSSSSGQVSGGKPEGCIMVNANWCGFEVKSYSDENGCWSASAECWTQSKACFDQAPPTGAKNCDLWTKKCNHLDDTCNAKQFTGPPDAGKDLTPTPPDLAATSYRKLMALVKKHESHMMRRGHRARR